jgi:hypothetical protein
MHEQQAATRELDALLLMGANQGLRGSGANDV